MNRTRLALAGLLFLARAAASPGRVVDGRVAAGGLAHEYHLRGA